MRPSASGCRLSRFPYFQTSTGMSCSSTDSWSSGGSDGTGNVGAACGGAPLAARVLAELELPSEQSPSTLPIAPAAACAIAGGLSQLTAATAPPMSGSTASSTARRPGCSSSGKMGVSGGARSKLYITSAASEAERLGMTATGCYTLSVASSMVPPTWLRGLDGLASGGVALEQQAPAAASWSGSGCGGSWRQPARY